MASNSSRPLLKHHKRMVVDLKPIKTRMVHTVHISKGQALLEQANNNLRSKVSSNSHSSRKR